MASAISSTPVLWEPLSPPRPKRKGKVALKPAPRIVVEDRLRAKVWNQIAVIANIIQHSTDVVDQKLHEVKFIELRIEAIAKKQCDREAPPSISIFMNFTYKSMDVMDGIVSNMNKEIKQVPQVDESTNRVGLLAALKIVVLKRATMERWYENLLQGETVVENMLHAIEKNLKKERNSQRSASEDSKEEVCE